MKPLPLPPAFLAAVLSATLISCSSSADETPVVNGFELTDLRIELDAIKSGGPPRDGIPSIDDPKFIEPGKADFMKDDDMVLSFTEGDLTRAYPLRVLVWHEIVNETINGRPILVTYCPLCGTAMIFEREVAGKVRSFGVSGLLYQSDVLMYDRESESLWSQLQMEAVSGPLAGTELKWLASEHLTWESWQKKYPDGEVLSTETGYQRNYGGEAYASYFNSPSVMFPVPGTRDELPQKAWVVGLLVEGEAVAFPLDDLEKAGTATQQVGDETVTVRFDADSRHATAKTEAGEEIPTVTLFWFAWQAFQPETALWRP